MIFNVIRTTLQLENYLDEINYPKFRIAIYLITSIVIGVILSTSPRAADLPILSVVAILFGFTINAVVMLGNSSEHYLSSDISHSDELKKYYKKSLYVSIHTLGVGIATIITSAIFRLFPEFDIRVLQMDILGHAINVELISAIAYILCVYYLISFSIVIASTAELVKIRV